MTYYFFHVRDDHALFEDTRGGEFSDFAAARTWALSDARSLIREGQLDGPAEQQWIDISDAAGVTVESLSFVEVLRRH